MGRGCVYLFCGWGAKFTLFNLYCAFNVLIIQYEVLLFDWEASPEVSE